MSSKFPVVHFEMPYHDAKRVSDFYSKAFGWNMRPLGEQMNDYVNAETTTTKDGRPTAAGHINGGFYPVKPDWPAQVPSVVIAVDDMAEAMKNVEAAGGTVLGEPMHIPGIGAYVSFTDSEGNRVSLLNPRM